MARTDAWFASDEAKKLVPIVLSYQTPSGGWSKAEAGKTDYVTDDQSTEVYWARFYDLKTQLPIFAGAEDGVIYSSFSEMANRNKVAYDYFTTKPRDVVTKEIQRWKKRVGL